MKLLNKMKNRAGVAGEVVSFLWRRKFYWIIPMAVILLIFGIIIALAQGSPLAPFIYTLF